MVKVRMKVSIVAADWSYVPQQEIDIDDDLAAKWVEVGHAEYIEEPQKKKGGVKSGSKANKSTKRGTSDTDGDENVSTS